MDPTSVFRAATAVIRQVKSYTAAVEDAPESCKSLLNELSAVQSVLEKLHRPNVQISGDGSLPPSVDDGQLKALEDTLNDILEWLKEVDPDKMTRRQKAAWPLEKRKMKIDEFLVRLERYKTLSTLMLSTEERFVICCLWAILATDC